MRVKCVSRTATESSVFSHSAMTFALTIEASLICVSALTSSSLRIESGMFFSLRHTIDRIHKQARRATSKHRKR